MWTVVNRLKKITAGHYTYRGFDICRFRLNYTTWEAINDVEMISEKTLKLLVKAIDQKLTVI